jgi:hypothetical protein
MEIPLLAAIIGFHTLVASIASLIYIWRAVISDRLPPYWWGIEATGLLAGVCLAAVVGVTFQGFEYHGGRAAGFPFVGAWYDSKGADYIGLLTLPAILGDLLVWVLMPQILLAVFARCQLYFRKPAKISG